METILIHRTADNREAKVLYVFGPTSSPKLEVTWTDNGVDTSLELSETDITPEQLEAAKAL